MEYTENDKKGWAKEVEEYEQRRRKEGRKEELQNTVELIEIQRREGQEQYLDSI